MQIRGQEELDQFIADQRKAAADALMRTTQRQWLIPAGGYVLRVDEGLGLPVCGRLLTIEEHLAQEAALAAQDPGDPFDGWAERVRMEATYGRGFVYGWWSSQIEPGEWGLAHRHSLLCSITEEVYRGFMDEWGGHPMPTVT